MHVCPECLEACSCGGDDDLEMSRAIDECTHCVFEEEEDEPDDDEEEDDDLDDDDSDEEEDDWNDDDDDEDGDEVVHGGESGDA